MFASPMSLDARNRRLTLLVGGLGLAGAAAAATSHGAVAFAVAVLIVVVLAVSWAMSPRGLVVEGDELRIERRAWTPVRVPLASIAGASPLASLRGRTLRLFGVGGFCGSYGLFSNDDLGRFRLYATRAGQAVLVRRSDELPMVLTPDDVAGTIAALQRRPRLAA